MSGFGRILLFGVIAATVAGIAGLRAQTQLADPRDAPKIFASTCSACHKSPQGLAKSGQVAGFLRQHYTTGPEMSAAMAAYLVAAGSAPAKKDKGQAAEHAAKGKKKQEQAAAQPQADHPDARERAAEAKERRTLRGKQQHAKASAEEPAPAHTPPPPTAEPVAHPAVAPAVPAAPTAEQHAAAAPAPAPAGPPPVVLDIPLPEMPTAPPADLSYSAFSSSPLP